MVGKEDLACSNWRIWKQFSFWYRQLVIGWKLKDSVTKSFVISLKRCQRLRRTVTLRKGNMGWSLLINFLFVRYGDNFLFSFCKTEQYSFSLNDKIKDLVRRSWRSNENVREAITKKGNLDQNDFRVYSISENFPLKHFRRMLFPYKTGIESKLSEGAWFFNWLITSRQ